MLDLVLLPPRPRLCALSKPQQKDVGILDLLADKLTVSIVTLPRYTLNRSARNFTFDEVFDDFHTIAFLASKGFGGPAPALDGAGSNASSCCGFHFLAERFLQRSKV